MKSIIGAHFIPVHNREIDYEYISKINAQINKIVGGPLDVNQVSRAYSASPNSILMLRDHPLSEQKQDMANDPVGTGQRHAKEMIAHYERMRIQAEERGLPYPTKDRVILIGINEPNLDAGPRQHMDYDVWLKESKRLAYVVDVYTKHFLDTLRQSGYIGGGMNISVGWPTNIVDDEPAVWDWFPQTYKAIKDGNHYLVVHEYWSHEGLDYNYGWWAGRVAAFCPWDVPIIIGEAGIDQYVLDGGVGKESRGWTGRDAQHKGILYIGEIIEYMRRCIDDGRIKSIMLFTSDCNHRDWGSFDLEPIYVPLIQAIRTFEYTSNKPIVLPPPISPPPTVPAEIMYVKAPAGLNVRSGPGMNYNVVDILPFGSQVDVYNEDYGNLNEVWSEIGNDRWVAKAYLSPNEPQFPRDPYIIHDKTTRSIVNSMAKMFGIETELVTALFLIESGGNISGHNGLPIIRFENHIFRNLLKNDELFNKHFKIGVPAWTDHYWRRAEHEPWQQQHLLGQESEWETLMFARTLDNDAAIQATSIGIGQIMGFHYQKLGFGSPEEMLEMMTDSPTVAQVIAFFSFLYNTKGLIAALQNKDLDSVAELYNGTGNVKSYVNKLQDMYQKVINNNT